jgi:hypothetical protein
MGGGRLSLCGKVQGTLQGFGLEVLLKTKLFNYIRKKAWTKLSIPLTVLKWLHSNRQMTPCSKINLYSTNRSLCGQESQIF